MRIRPAFPLRPRFLQRPVRTWSSRGSSCSPSPYAHASKQPHRTGGWCDGYTRLLSKLSVAGGTPWDILHVAGVDSVLSRPRLENPMDHEPGADAPGPDPESADTPEAPPRVPPFIAPPAAWGEPHRRRPSPPTARRHRRSPPRPSRRRARAPRPKAPTRPMRRVDRLASPGRAGHAGARRQRTAAALVGVEHRGPPTGRRRCRSRVRRHRHRRCIEPKRNGGMRSAVVGGIAGAIVGALIAGGLLVAFDDDPQPQHVRRQSAVERQHGAARERASSSPATSAASSSAARPAVVRIDVEAQRRRSNGYGLHRRRQRRHRHERARRRRSRRSDGAPRRRRARSPATSSAPTRGSTSRS